MGENIRNNSSMPTSDAEREFAAHNWETDQTWQEKMRNIELPAVDEQAALLRLKRKYFKQNFNSELEISGTTQSSQSSSPPPQPQPAPRPSQPEPTFRAPPPRQPTRPAPPAPPVSLKSRQGICFLLNFATILFAMGYVAPTAFSPTSYQLSLVSAIASLAIVVQSSGLVGRHTLNKEGIARLLSNSTAQYILFGLIHLPFQPILFTLVPLVTIAFYNVCEFSKSMMSSFPEKYRQQLTTHLNEATQPDAVQGMLLNNALVEIILLFMLLFLALFGRGGLFHFILQLQFVRFKFATSQHSQHAWGMVGNKLDGLFYHRLCPQPVGAVYGKIKVLLRRYATGA
eukprot:c6080_g1_i1.p1 GENE.c6080_g1_i1~~c6080_g1_i1.p1  ORF type:complete len:342 (-),score=56.84 c6080_g1_i1:26-1051(-)